MRSYLVVFLLSILGFTSCSSKKIILSEKNKKIYLQPDYKTDTTTLVTEKIGTRFPYKYYLDSSSEFKKNKEIYFTMIGLDINFVINFKNQPIPKILLISDYNQYDGKHQKEIKLSKFELLINKDKIKDGDIVMGEIACETEENKYSKPIKIKGTFIHTVGIAKLVFRNQKGISKIVYDNILK